MSLPPPDQAPSAEPSIGQWFAAEVHPHDSSLKAYLRGAFPVVRDIDDVVQESYLRILKAKAARPIRSSRAFLFRIARHVAIDLVRRERISPIKDLGDFDCLSVIEDGPGVAALLSQREKIQLLGRAVGSLPARCREIILLHKIQGLSQREVAGRLGLSEKTVENQISLGVKRCDKFFRERGIEYY